MLIGQILLCLYDANSEIHVIPPDKIWNMVRMLEHVRVYVKGIVYV
jgi:hypothetical protein